MGMLQIWNGPRNPVRHSWWLWFVQPFVRLLYYHLKRNEINNNSTIFSMLNSTGTLNLYQNKTLHLVWMRTFCREFPNDMNWTIPELRGLSPTSVLKNGSDFGPNFYPDDKISLDTLLAIMSIDPVSIATWQPWNTWTVLALLPGAVYWRFIDLFEWNVVLLYHLNENISSPGLHCPVSCCHDAVHVQGLWEIWRLTGEPNRTRFLEVS